MRKYKLSKYNFFKNKKDKVIGVNLFDKRMFSIDLLTYEKLVSNQDDLVSLEENDSLVFSTMYKLGVIEDEDADIPSILLMRNRERVLSTEHYRLIILPTLNCNFSCWYCYETRARKIMDTNTVTNIIVIALPIVLPDIPHLMAVMAEVPGIRMIRMLGLCQPGSVLVNTFL